MTFPEFDNFVETIFDRLRELRKTKGREYANNDQDRLANFKDIAVEIGITPLQVLQTYMKKHSRAIDSYIKRGKIFSDESIESRFTDQIMYSLLALGLIKDLKGANLNERKTKRSSGRSRVRPISNKTKRKRIKSSLRKNKKTRI